MQVNKNIINIKTYFMNDKLLIPRFKFIADYPGCNREIGSVAIEEHTAQYFRKFPKNFRELEWWEERNPDELPQYLKEAETGEVVKVTNYHIESYPQCFYTDKLDTKGTFKGLPEPFNIRAMIPTTEAEFFTATIKTIIHATT